MADRKRPVWRSIGFVADYLDVNPKTVRRYIAAGKLKAYRVGKGGPIRIDLNEVDESLLRRIPTANDYE